MAGPHGRRVAPTQPRQLRIDDLGTPLIDVAFVVVDLETTGVDPARDRITEVGAIRSRAGEVTGELSTMVDPGRPVPPAITAVTGISDAMLAGCPPIEAVLPSVQELLRGGVFVAHNAAFDQRFLDAALERSGRGRIDVPVLDTARLARRVLGEETRSVKLSTLARHLGARTTPNHRALPDARATLDVLHALIERASAFGATTLEDLLDLQRSTSSKAYRRIDLVKDAPRSPGTYRFLGADGEVLYVGTTVDLRTRLRRYFGQDKRRKVSDLVQATARVEWTVCPTGLEAQVREVREIHHHRPRFNRRSRQPEKAAWIGLTREAFPRLTVTSKPPADGPALGPLAGRKQAAQVVAALQQVLPVRACTMRLRVRQDHAPCVLKELGRCASPCDGTQSRDAYAADVARVREVLACRDASVLRDLRAQMRTLAGAGRFEDAAEARARLHALARAIDRTRTLRRMLGAGRVVAARVVGDEADRVEVVEVREGRLEATRVAERDAAPRLDLGAAPPGDAPVGRSGDAASRSDAAVAIDPRDVEEALILASWLDQPGTVALHVEGAWCQDLDGGGLLATSVREARELARQLRRDRIALSGRKVTTRATPEAAAASIGSRAGTVAS